MLTPAPLPHTHTTTTTTIVLSAKDDCNTWITWSQFICHLKGFDDTSTKVFCLKQGGPEDIVNIVSSFLNIHNCFTIGPIWAEVQQMEN